MKVYQKNWFILVASALDALTTHVGIWLGFIEEGNPLMQWVMEQSYLGFYFIKLSFPLLLIYMFARWNLQSRVLHRLYAVVLFLYTTLLLYHITWIVMVLLYTPST